MVRADQILHGWNISRQVMCFNQVSHKIREEERQLPLRPSPTLLGVLVSNNIVQHMFYAENEGF